VKIRMRNKGFTLLELLSTLTIASLVVTMGVPSFRTVLESQRMTGATNEMVMALNLAKSEAIKRVAYVSVCKSSDMLSCGNGGVSWNDGWIVFANATTANLGIIDGNDVVLRVYPAIHDSIDVTASGTVDGFVSFRPSGTMGTAAANFNGTLTVCDRRGDPGARGILLEPSGRWQVSHVLAHDNNALSC
jgi:type IV fimbrial biogenesis protein FimT